MAIGANSSPGVYVKEQDRSQVISPASTSVGAIVGESHRGAVGVRTLVTSTQQFLAEFGAPDASLGFMHHSALAFLQNADRLYVTRVAPNAKTGGASLFLSDNGINFLEAWPEGELDPSAHDFAFDELLAVYAANPGEWNQTLRVRMYPSTIYNDGSFNVDVFEGSAAQPVESYRVHLNFVVDGFGNQMNIENQINRQSSRIRVVQNFENAAYLVNPNRHFISAVTTVTLAGGTNGDRATIGQFMQAWNLYEDKEQVSVNMLISGGLTAPPIQQRMDAICESRMDCIAILDVPQLSQKVEQALLYRNTELTLNSNYSALYCCDVYVLDQYSGRRLYVPVSGYVAGAYAATDRDYATWFAPAGLIRGKLKVLGVRHVYNQGDRDTLVESQINPVRVIEGIGISIWGADTLQTMASALSNVNVRRLMMFIETSIAEAVDYSVFDPNDAVLRTSLVEMCERFLQPIEDGRGLHWFGVQCDEGNNPPEITASGDLILDIAVDPVLPAKRILIQATINKTGSRTTFGVDDSA